MKSVKESIGVPIDLSDLNMESHVKLAFRIAKALANNQPINARHALQGAELAIQRINSDAFSFIVSLLPQPDLKTPPKKQMPAKNELLFSLSEPLANSYSISKRFFLQGDTVWGRDFITMVLLAKNDPSLNEIAQEKNLTVELLQDKWYEFVSSTSRNRTPEGWRDWWHSAEVPTPNERISGPEKEEKPPSSSTYLFTWNPNKFNWSKLERFSEEFKKTGSTVFSWSLGQRKKVSIGDRVFLMRQTKEPGGIVGSGKIVGEVKKAPHWDEELKKEDKTYNLVSIQWDALSEKPILPLDELIKETKEEKLWKSQVGGISIPTDTAGLLETAWKEALDKQVIISFPAGPDIARVESDSVSADAKDHLNVEREANAFARVAASSKTMPPLSVGVFGEWGSGKTFFMEKMHAHVERLRETAIEAENSASAYHSNIVQIRFNAWHYMEANLWASLVDHIFRELDNWLRPEHEDKIEALFERLSTTRMLKLEAVKSLVESRRREKEAKTNLEMARNKLAEMESNKESITLAQFWDAVKGLFTDSDQKLLSEKDKKKIADAAETLGFKDAAGSARELIDALNKAFEQGQRGHLILRSLISRLGSFKWVVPLVTLLILVPAFLPSFIEIFENTKALEFFKPLLDQISSTVIALSSAAVTAAGWIGAASGSAKKALNRLIGFQSQLDKKLKERQDKTPNPILEAELLLSIQRKEVRNAEEGFERAAILLNQARFKFGASARSRLDQFIRDKITNGDYAKHLGIIASIRKDFEQLAQIMSDVETEQGKRSDIEIQNEREENKYKAEIKALLDSEFLSKDEKEEIEEQGKPSDKDLKFFQRIVLYIDDLDRCPPEKVVEVLQACHLLLCFPLFIVVVAVDARWVSRALLVRYEKLLEEDTNEESSASRADHIEGTASPRDYLEKIFQIPYWVRRMHGKASKDYAEELVGPVLEEIDKGSKKSGKGDSAEHTGTKDDRQIPIEDGSLKPLPQDPSSETKGIIDSKSTAKKPNDKGAKRKPSDPQQAGSGGEELRLDPNPKSLMLTQHEKDFIGKLAPFAGQSPRTIKRFVNVYRLLRTGLSIEILDGLVGKKGESRTYKAILGQLAIVTGAPTLADRYFRVLEKDIEEPLSFTSLLSELESKPQANNKKNLDLLSIYKSPEWKSLRGVIKLLESSDNSPEMITEIKDYANIVKRYSFSARPYM